MKAKDLKLNEKTIELLDGKHKIAIDFNAFEELENIYGDMQSAFAGFTSTNVKFKDVKNFITAGLNACIEDEEDKLTTFQVGKLIDLSKMSEYVTVLADLMNKAMPSKKVDEDEEDEKN